MKDPDDFLCFDIAWRHELILLNCVAVRRWLNIVYIDTYSIIDCFVVLFQISHGNSLYLDEMSSPTRAAEY